MGITGRWRRENVAQNAKWFRNHLEDPWKSWRRLIHRYLPTGATVVDLGSGPMHAGREWIDENAGGTDDVLTISMDHDREVLVVNPNPNCVAGTVERLPLREASVDVVLSRYVLEHLENPEQSLAEVSRVLRPGGLFLFVTPHALFYVSLAARVTPTAFHARFYDLLGHDDADIRVYPTFYRANTPWVLRSAACRAGLRLTELEGHVGPPEYTAVLPPLLHRAFIGWHRILEDHEWLQRLLGPVLLGVMRKTGDGEIGSEATTESRVSSRT